MPGDPGQAENKVTNSKFAKTWGGKQFFQKCWKKPAWLEGIIARNEIGEGAGSQISQGLYILLEEAVCEKGIQDLGMSKRAGMKRWELSGGTWAGRMRCQLGKTVPMASLAMDLLPLIIHLGFLGQDGRGWAPLLHQQALQGPHSLAKAYLSTLTDLKVCAPLCLSASLGGFQQKSRTDSVNWITEEKALVHSANRNPSPRYLSMLNVLKKPTAHASTAALNWHNMGHLSTWN